MMNDSLPAEAVRPAPTVRQVDQARAVESAAGLFVDVPDSLDYLADTLYIVARARGWTGHLLCELLARTGRVLSRGASADLLPETFERTLLHAGLPGFLAEMLAKVLKGELSDGFAESLSREDLARIVTALVPFVCPEREECEVAWAE